MPSTWRLRCHAAPRLVGGFGNDRVLALARKDAALLAYVALNGAAASTAVASLLWPASDERGAMNNLRQRLHRLRRETGARLLEVTATARLADDLALDVRPTARALEADPTAWDDELLETYRYDDASEFSAWLALRRKQWAETRFEALARIASDAERGGELARALCYAQRLRAHEPLSEHAHRRLMRLHYLRGDVAAAVSAFEACEHTLRDELGLRPSAETVELLQTIERGIVIARPAALPMQVGLLRPPRSVGRDGERARLAQAHHDGLSVVVVGEAGMGKTRLLREFVASIPHAIYAQARPGDVSAPYGALARLLKAVVAAVPTAIEKARSRELARISPELGEAGGGAATGQPARMQLAIERLLEVALDTDGLTLVLDDLHFADRASIEMLRALLDSDPLLPLRWVFAHRPVAAAEADATLLDALADAERVCWVSLSPLNEMALLELLSELALPNFEAGAFVPALMQHTGGNPLYVLETLRAAHAAPTGPANALVLPRPASVAHLIDRRLQRLSEDALSLGRVAALAGPDFSPELAEHALSTPALRLATAWGELEAADVLRGHEFAHDLVRDGMLRATPQAIARHAHKQIAQFLEQGACEPARVAAHWLAAGYHARAAQGFQAAADRARLAGRPREQAALLLRSADALADAGEAERALAVRSSALRPMLHGQGLPDADALSLQLIEAAGNGPLAGLAWTRRASLLMSAGRGAQAESAGRRALELIGADQQALQVEATAALAIACMACGKGEEGLALMRPWVDRMGEIEDPALRIEFCSAHAVLLHHADRLDEAARAVARQIDLIRTAGEEGELAVASLSLAALELRRGDADRAHRLAAGAAELQVQHDEPGLVLSYTRFLTGSALCALARYEDGLHALQAACDGLARSNPGTQVHSNAEVVMAEVLLQLGQAARANQLISCDHDGLNDAAKARRRVARAAVRRVMRGSATAVDTSALSPDDSYAGMLASIESARALEPVEGITVCDRVRARAARNGDRVVDMLAATVRLDALRAAGRSQAVFAAADELEQLLPGCRSTLIYPPEVWLACARANAAIGRREAAIRCRDAALRWIRHDALGHVPAVYRNAFLNRHPVNTALEIEAGELGVKPAER